MCDLGGEPQVITDLEEKCAQLRREIADVLQEPIGPPMIAQQ